MLKIGHRGASAHYPENTLLAFKKAITMGADGVECDVHVCASGEVVVIHDSKLKRTTGAKGTVARSSLTALRKLDAGKGEPIPTLKELLTALTPKSTVFVEIKAAKAARAAAKVITELAEQKKIPYKKMPVISFRLSHLKAVKSVNSKIVVGLSPAERKSALSKSFIKTAVKFGMWSVNPCIRVLDKKFVDMAHAAGLKVITWTANSKIDIEKAIALGVDGIMSDYPERLHTYRS